MQIQMTDIEKTFQSGPSLVRVLRGISLRIDQGEMIAIKGASGAGKSTLLHLLGCLKTPTSGEYLLNGVNVAEASSRTLSRIRNQTIGFVMQHFALIEDDDVLTNVVTPLLFSSVRRKAMKEMAMDRLRQLGMDSMKDQRVSKLSGGEKQRVAIARALVTSPDILLADEPTGALDQANAHVVMEIFKTLNRDGKTVIIVTHDDQIAQQCQRIITIADGKIVF